MLQRASESDRSARLKFLDEEAKSRSAAREQFAIASIAAPIQSCLPGNEAREVCRMLKLENEILRHPKLEARTLRFSTLARGP